MPDWLGSYDKPAIAQLVGKSSGFGRMGKQKKTRKFSVAKSMISSKDPRIKTNQEAASKKAKEEVEKKKIGKKKYSEEQVNIIKGYQDMRWKMSMTQLNNIIEKKEKIKISTTTLKKILNGEY